MTEGLFFQIHTFPPLCAVISEVKPVGRCEASGSLLKYKVTLSKKRYEIPIRKVKIKLNCNILSFIKTNFACKLTLNGQNPFKEDDQLL